MNAPPRSDDLLARIEDAGINASAAPQQRWVDGWLVRFCPGAAKRARCIQAVASGNLGIEEKLARALPVFAAAGMRPYVRITPFSQPPGLDERLAELGMERIDDTRVMVRARLDDLVARASAGQEAVSFEGVEADAYAEWIGGARGSSAAERRAHADRVAHAPVPHHAFFGRGANGVVVCGGQVVLEADIAGLYDVMTLASERRRGHAERLCRHLLAWAAARGATVGYLQVDAANDAARRIYRRLGFVDAYAYHYRSPPLVAP